MSSNKFVDLADNAVLVLFAVYVICVAVIVATGFYCTVLVFLGSTWDQLLRYAGIPVIWVVVGIAVTGLCASLLLKIDNASYRMRTQYK